MRGRGDCLGVARVATETSRLGKFGRKTGIATLSRADKELPQCFLGMMVIVHTQESPKKG